MNIYIEETISATAYVVTGALAMITAEVPIRNTEGFAQEFSLYNQILDPSGRIVTTTETRYRLGSDSGETILDELLRVKDPIDELNGYTMRSLLLVGEEVVDTKEVEIRKA